MKILGSHASEYVFVLGNSVKVEFVYWNHGNNNAREWMRLVNFKDDLPRLYALGSDTDNHALKKNLIL